MHYLFFDNVSDLEKDFRYDMYKLHGLQKQFGFKPMNVNSEIESLLKKIKSELQTVEANIKESEFYLKATEKERRNFLKPRYAKLVKSDDLFESSGLTKSRINVMWQLYSNYAHSEHISDRQYNTSYIIKKSFIEESSLIITINLILTSKLIVRISENFNGAKKEYAKLNEKEKFFTETWDSLNQN